MEKNQWRYLKLLTSKEITDILNISIYTLNNWYNWYNDCSYDKPYDLPDLPKYHQANPHAKKYWDEKDVEQLKIFQEYINANKGRRGVMGEYTKRYRPKEV